mgnify:CR=1 FL=1
MLFRSEVIIRSEAVGVVAAIVPWIVPQFVTMSKLAPALLAGCSIVIKPAPETPLDAMMMAELIAEAGIPGFTMITPYENATKGDPRFMHFYEFDDADAEVTFKRMRPLVEANIGPWGSPACDRWAVHPALRIMYVNSFTLVGDATP